MNVLKSIIIAICLLFLTILSIYFICKCAKSRINKGIVKRHFYFTLCCCLITILCFILLGDYMYPFERTVKPTLIAEFVVPEEYELDYPGQKFWHGAYESFGLYAESLYFDPNEECSIYGFGWPPMDFNNYCFIITYGQQIDSLSYNVWETIDTPIKTGAKTGHMILDDEFSPEKVYIYQIPKIRIENDINKTLNNSDLT